MIDTRNSNYRYFAKGTESAVKSYTARQGRGVSMPLRKRFSLFAQRSDTVDRSSAGRAPHGGLIKRVLDVAIAATAIAMLFPACLAISLVILSYGSKIFFRHERVGHDGRRFKCLKFQTMVPDAELALQGLLERDPAAAAEWAATRKLRRDPRVTPVGRFLRATSLDELPQFINVLVGDMSLVGPRPVVHAELERYGTNIGYYLAARPGLTGAWQISGRSDASYTQRVALDTDYILNWSIWTDLAILFKTIPAVTLRRGAC